MAAVLWPQVVNWMVDTLPALWPSVNVFDGPPVTGDQPTDYVAVCYVEGDTAGTWQAVKAETGLSNSESGTVISTLVCQSGDEPDAAMEQVRVRAVDYVDLLSDALDADQTLAGTLALDALVELQADVLPIQNTSGTAIQMRLVLSYQSSAWRS